MTKRERKQLTKIEARLDRFAARIETALLAGEARIESLRRLEAAVHEGLANLRERPGHLSITGMDELIALIESVRHVGDRASAQADQVSADQFRGEPESGEPSATQPDEAEAAGTPDGVEHRLPPVTEADVAAWRPAENMRLSEVDLGRDAP